MASVWDSIVAETEKKFEENGTNIKFNSPKNDDSHIKAKTGFTSSYWTFCKTSSSVWIELEFKPRTLNSEKIPQDQLFEKLKSNKNEIEKKLGKPLSFELGGNDRRVKMFLRNDGIVESSDSDEFSNYMINFVDSLSPYL